MYSYLRGTEMLYRILFNYFRIQIIRWLINAATQRHTTGKNLKTMNLVGYCLELILSRFLFASKK